MTAPLFAAILAYACVWCPLGQELLNDSETCLLQVHGALKHGGRQRFSDSEFKELPTVVTVTASKQDSQKADEAMADAAVPGLLAAEATAAAQKAAADAQGAAMEGSARFAEKGRMWSHASDESAGRMNKALVDSVAADSAGKLVVTAGLDDTAAHIAAGLLNSSAAYAAAGLLNASATQRATGLLDGSDALDAMTAMTKAVDVAAALVNGSLGDLMASYPKLGGLAAGMAAQAAAVQDTESAEDAVRDKVKRTLNGTDSEFLVGKAAAADAAVQSVLAASKDVAAKMVAMLHPTMLVASTAPFRYSDLGSQMPSRLDYASMK